MLRLILGGIRLYLCVCSLLRRPRLKGIGQVGYPESLVSLLVRLQFAPRLGVEAGLPIGLLVQPIGRHLPRLWTGKEYQVD